MRPINDHLNSYSGDTAHARINKKSTGKRRFHKKSRKGCATCKKRRVKCDEGRPVCGNCDRMGIECVYLSSHENSKHDSDHEVENENEVEHENQIQNQNQNGPSQEQEHEQEQERQQSIDSPEISSNYPMTPASSMPPTSPLGYLSQIPILSGMPEEMQHKLFQQFQELPADKRQQMISQFMPSNLPPDSLAKMSSLLTKSNGLDPLPGFMGEFIPPQDTNRNKHNNNSSTPTPQELAAQFQKRAFPLPSNNLPNNAGPSLSPDSIKSTLPPLSNNGSSSTPPVTDLNMLDLRLMYHYTTKVWPTITAAGISDSKIWSDDIPMLAFKYPFLMHSILAFSATHLSRTERGLDQCVTCHRADALRLLREAVLEMSPENTDALVAAALILIMDSLANASLPTSSSIKSLPPSAWIFHVKGAATILTAVWPLSEKSRFYKFISVDLGDLGEIGYDLISGELSNTSDSGISNENSRSNSISRDSKQNSQSPPTSTTTSPKEKFGDNKESNNRNNYKGTSTPDLSTLASMAAETCSKSNKPRFSSIKCFDDEIEDMFPVPLNSPYFPTLAYMAKLHKEINKSDFILRIFAFPALLDKRFLGLLINCDLSAMRIMRCYYKLLRNFTEEMKEKVWFLEGVSSVLPVDVEQYAGGGGMHMMLDFLGGPSTIDDDGNGVNYVAKRAAQSGLLDTNNLPSASMSDSLGLDDNSGLNEAENADGDDFMGV